MTPIELNIVLFALAVVAFAAFGFSASRKQRSAKDYFHDASLFKNAVSLTATNITLGTGLVYLVSGAQHNGLLMLLTPLAVMAGYWLMAAFLGRATNVVACTGKNFLAGVDQQIAEATGRPSSFAKLISGSLVIIFVLVLAFEIFTSAKVLSPFLFTNPTNRAEVWLSLIVFCITILYTILGGITAVLRVDVLQVPLIGLMIPVFIITTIPGLDDPGATLRRLGGTLNMNSAVIVGTAIVVINAVATQFYSILNWGAVSHVEVKNQQRLLRWVGAATAVVLTLFILVGLLHPVAPGAQVWQDITQRYVALASQTNLTAYLFSAILLLGMASILLTTTDAVVITSIMFWYDNVAGGDSKNSAHDPRELRRIRGIGTVAFTLCFAVLMTINYWQPDPFYLLLSMSGGVAVFAPMIVAAGWLTSKGSSLRMFTPSVIYVFFGLFLLAGVFSIVLLLRGSPYVGYVGVSSFTASLILALALVIRSRRSAMLVTPEST